MADIRIRFGARLRSLRKRLGLTQVEFAEKVGLDRTYVGSIERGERNVSLVNLDLLAQALGTTLGKMLSRL